MQTNIILTGFMGTGKTTLGKLLAKRIDYKFIDTDALIEEQTGLSIEAIFKNDGEAKFRKLEAELVVKLAQKQGLVIATGGGLVLNPENVITLNKTGKIICLTAKPKDILARVSSQKTVRPLLQEADPQAKIEELLLQRAPIYQQFPQLSTSELSVSELVNRLSKFIG